MNLPGFFFLGFFNSTGATGAGFLKELKRDLNHFMHMNP